MNWYIGQKVVCVSIEDLIIKTLKIGEVYTISDILISKEPSGHGLFLLVVPV